MRPEVKAGMLATQKKFDAKAAGKNGDITFHFEAGKGREFITLLVGAKPTKSEMPTPAQLEQLMGQIGFFTGEDITEVFGDKGFRKLEAFLLKKWSKTPESEDK